MVVVPEAPLVQPLFPGIEGDVDHGAVHGTCVERQGRRRVDQDVGVGDRVHEQAILLLGGQVRAQRTVPAESRKLEPHGALLVDVVVPAPPVPRMAPDDELRPVRKLPRVGHAGQSLDQVVFAVEEVGRAEPVEEDRPGRIEAQGSAVLLPGDQDAVVAIGVEVGYANHAHGCATRLGVVTAELLFHPRGPDQVPLMGHEGGALRGEIVPGVDRGSRPEPEAASHQERGRLHLAVRERGQDEVGADVAEQRRQALCQGGVGPGEKSLLASP
jgi:hypothetical protein